VLYDLYFLLSQFYILPNLVPVVYEKTEMVPPSNFSSKTNVQPRHPTGVGVHARHLSPWHTSTLMWLPIFFLILMISYIYIKKKQKKKQKTKIWGGCHTHFGQGGG
jgi:hypothetical protein